MTRTRVLIVGTPLGARDAMNGSALAIRELAEALADRDEVRPIVLVERDADVPEGVEACVVNRSRIDSFFRAITRTRADVVHAIFAPRRRTAMGLRAIGATSRAPIVQTIASAPRAWARQLFVGDRIVATSAWARQAILATGIAAERVVEIAMPFTAPKITPAIHHERTERARLLFVGDLEHGDAIEPTISALRAMAGRAMSDGATAGEAELVVAARDKSPAAVAIKTRLLAAIARDATLADRVRWIGEVASLLPWIASARAVLLPASSTYAKLDHPRALLEAIALGTPIVVGRAPSLAELVTAPSIGRVVHDERQLTSAMEAALTAPRIDASTAQRILAPRAPTTIAAQYARLYAAIRRA